MADYIDAVVFGFILSFSFGPIFFILLETSITRGIKQAVFMDFGVIVSDLLFFSLAYFGASKIATEENQPALFLLGGVILSVYSVISFINNAVKNKKIKKEKAVEETRLFKYVVKGFLLNIINISYLVIWAGVIVWFGPKVEMSPVKIWTFFFVSENSCSRASCASRPMGWMPAHPRRRPASRATLPREVGRLPSGNST